VPVDAGFLRDKVAMLKNMTKTNAATHAVSQFVSQFVQGKSFISFIAL
jgi:hypothetical protein